MRSKHLFLEPNSSDNQLLTTIIDNQKDILDKAIGHLVYDWFTKRKFDKTYVELSTLDIFLLQDIKDECIKAKFYFDQVCDQEQWDGLE